ncbi:MAG: hypothetical protein ACSLFB_00205 [Acidimicrobiales bacterium]
MFEPCPTLTVATTTSPMLVETGSAIARDETVSAALVAELGRPRRVTISGSVTLRSTIRSVASIGSAARSGDRLG